MAPCRSGATLSVHQTRCFIWGNGRDGRGRWAVGREAGSGVFEMERRGDLNGTERHLISSHLISRQKNEKEGRLHQSCTDI